MLNCRKCLSDPRYLVLIGSIIALAAAYFIEYHFKVPPCRLCLYQRYIYYALAGTAFATALISNLSPKHTYVMEVVQKALFGFLLFVGIALSIFQFSIEKDIINVHSRCTGNPAFEAKSIEEFHRNLQGADIISCKYNSFSLFGVSLSFANAIYMIALVIATVCLYRSRMQKNIQ